MLHTSPPTSRTATQAAALSTAGTDSLPRVLLHLEGLAVFASAVALYAHQGWSWGVFFALLLAPDLAMIAYVAGPTTGARGYNLAHFYALPLALGMAGLFTETTLAMQLAAIWLAHIGIDRALGYGLKYASGFKDTHLTRV